MTTIEKMIMFLKIIYRCDVVTIKIPIASSKKKFSGQIPEIERKACEMLNSKIILGKQ